MPSQYGEDRFITQFFGDRKGRFLDVGAFDGIHFSNTEALAARGWGGTLVEPAPGPFSALLDLYGKRSDIILINALVHSERGLIRFYESYGDALSSICPTHTANWSTRVKFRQYFAVAITWQDLISVAPGPYAFMNIDTEGVNDKVLMSAPLPEIGAELICVEKDPHEQIRTMIEFMTSQGYAVAADIGGNLLFSRGAA